LCRNLKKKINPTVKKKRKEKRKEKKKIRYCVEKD
jgi:hypothetical protein